MKRQHRPMILIMNPELIDDSDIPDDRMTDRLVGCHFLLI